MGASFPSTPPTLRDNDALGKKIISIGQIQICSLDDGTIQNRGYIPRLNLEQDFRFGRDLVIHAIDIETEQVVELAAESGDVGNLVDVFGRHAFP